MSNKLSDKEKTILKVFDIDFDRLKIQLPNNAETTIIITDQLLLNKDLPADILMKMSKCAAIYARYGNIRGDLITYQSLLNDKYDVTLKKWKAKARTSLDGKPSESLVEEKAILANVNSWKELRKEMRKVEKGIEKVKRVMKAIEIQAEMARSIASYIKREMELTEGEPVLKNKHGNFSEEDH